MVKQFEVMYSKAMEILNELSNSDHDYVYQGILFSLWKFEKLKNSN